MTENLTIPGGSSAETVPTAPAPGGRLWPTVIGALSIVLGVQGVLSVTSTEAINRLGDLLGDGGSPAFMASDPRGTTGQVLDGVETGLWLILILAGVLLWRRRRAGRLLHVLFTILTLCFAITPDRWVSRPGLDFGHWRWVASVIVQLAYTIFLLAWFGRRMIRQEVRSWRAPEARARPTHPVGSVWPIVIGTVCIVLGARQLCLSGSEFASHLHALWGVDRPVSDAYGSHDYPLAMGILCGVSFQLALAVSLGVGGWLLLRRRRTGALWLLAFALLSTVYHPLSDWLVGALAQALASPRAPAIYIIYMGYECVVLDLAWAAPGMVFPLFLLVWFLRPGIRRQVKSWKSPSPTAISS